MENLCHTLAGAVLAKTGLERVTPLALPTLLIGANLPDIDLVTRLDGPVAYLQHHRGITHSLVGVIGLAVLLALLMLAVDRWGWQRLRKKPERARLGGLLIVSLIGVTSHPLLDYTNSYGIRPFLPWNDQWYYGDLVFIVDPWLWLILGGAVFWLTSQTREQLMGWGLLWGFMSLIVLGAHIALTWQRQPPLGLAWLWLMLLGIIVLARWRGIQRYGAKLAVGSLIVTAGYWAMLAVAHTMALRHIEAASRLVSAGEATARHAALPRPATPLMWDGLFETSQEVFYGVVSITSGHERNWSVKRFPKRLDDPLVRQAINTCAGATMLTFARYPFAEVERHENGSTIILRDARYERKQKSGFAVMTIPLDESLKGGDHTSGP
jgi:inner membrane protein